MNQHKTVGGVVHTRYIVLKGDGKTDGRTESRKLCPSAFLRKGKGQKSMAQTTSHPATHVLGF